MNTDRTQSRLSETVLPLAPEADASRGNPDVKTDAVIEQAKADLDAGLVDTDMRDTPGLDAALRDALVPGPGGNPPGRKRGQDG